MKDGFLVINKPGGMTSHDVVNIVRKKFGMRRIGHAGTLDPLATGVMIILVGKATKWFDRFVAMDKLYRATMVLGLTTHSADIEGRLLENKPYDHVGREDLDRVFSQYLGEIEQVPPMVSAVKVKGKKLYELARKGIEIERQPRTVQIHELVIEDVRIPEVIFRMGCSKGTYVRQLVDDIGRDLGCGACISQIERLSVGKFKIEESLLLDEIHESHIRDWQS